MPTNYNLSNISDISWGEPAVRYVSSVGNWVWSGNAHSNAEWIRASVYDSVMKAICPDSFQIEEDKQFSLKEVSAKEVTVKEIEGESTELDTFLKSFQINTN